MSKNDQPRVLSSKKDFQWKNGYPVYTPHEEGDGMRWQVTVYREDANSARFYVSSLREIQPLCRTFQDASQQQSSHYGKFVTICVTVHAYFEDEQVVSANEVVVLAFCEGFGTIMIPEVTPQNGEVSEGKTSGSNSTQPTLWITKFGTDSKILCLDDLMLEIKHCNFLDKKRFILALGMFLETGAHGTADKPYRFDVNGEALCVDWEKIPYRWCNEGDE